MAIYKVHLKFLQVGAEDLGHHASKAEEKSKNKTEAYKIGFSKSRLVFLSYSYSSYST